MILVYEVLGIMAASTFAFASGRPVEPWHWHNPPATAQPPATQAPPAAQLTPGVNPSLPPLKKGKSKSDGLGQQLIKQAIEHLSNRSEKIGGTDGNGGEDSLDSSTSSGHATSLDVGKPAGTGQNGMPLVNINGCTQEKGRFQFTYGHGSETGCDRQLTMGEEFSEFLNSTLSRCANQAAGTSSFEVGKIWHASSMPSAEHLARSPNSLHNFGAAIDLNAIQIDNRKFIFADAKSDPATREFVDKFRKCWGHAAQNWRSGCLPNRSSGMPHGTIGHEDPNHQNHFHISLPFCPEVARSLGGVNIASINIFLGSLAHANPKAKSDLPPATVSHKTLNVYGGQAKLTVKNTHGEPIDAGYRLSLEVTCSKSKEKFTIMNEHEACSFEEFRLNKKNGMLEVVYRTSVFEGGRAVCRKTEVAKFKGRCP